VDGGTAGAVGDADAPGHPADGDAEAALPFQTAVTEEIGVDGTIEDVEGQIRDDEVVELFPHECGIGDFAFHGCDPKRKSARRGAPGGRP
jgi:hypothetical protein